MIKKLPRGYGYPADFAKGELDYLSNYNIKRQAFGGTTPYLIPGLYAGPILMFYRKDLLKDAGIRVPTNWTQYLAAAQKLNGNGIAGNTMIAKSGDVSMFLVDWFTQVREHRRRPHERIAAEEELRPSAHEPEGGRRAAAHGRLRPGIDTGRPLLRLHRCRATPSAPARRR